MQRSSETKDELKNLIKCLKKNGYKYHTTYNASSEGSKDQDIEATFEKENLDVDDGNGGMANDSHIFVTVAFDSRADANNYLEDPINDPEDLDYGYNYSLDRAAKFVDHLYRGIHITRIPSHKIPSHNANGGSKKRRKTRKTKK